LKDWELIQSQGTVVEMSDKNLVMENCLLLGLIIL